MAALELLPLLHRRLGIAARHAHDAVTHDTARHRCLDGIMQTIELARRIAVHRLPARDPGAFRIIEIAREIARESELTVFHRQPDTLPHLLARHVAGLFPRHEHRIARRGQRFAGEPEFLDLGHQRRRRRGALGPQQLRQALALKLGVVLDVLILAQERLPLAFTCQLAQPFLADDVTDGRVAVFLEKSTNPVRRGQCQTVLEQFVFDVTAQYIAVEPRQKLLGAREVAVARRLHGGEVVAPRGILGSRRRRRRKYACDQRGHEQPSPGSL